MIVVLQRNMIVVDFFTNLVRNSFVCVWGGGTTSMTRIVRLLHPCTYNHINAHGTPGSSQPCWQGRLLPRVPWGSTGLVKRRSTTTTDSSSYTRSTGQMLHKTPPEMLEGSSSSWEEGKEGAQRHREHSTTPLAASSATGQLDCWP
jgi:hypothetical protein